MSYPMIAVANCFIKRFINGDSVLKDLSPMKLQKLMFFAQSWNLKIFDKPLIDDSFAKWEYGPVIPSLYYKVKGYGSKNINQYISDISYNERKEKITTPIIPDTDKNSWQLIDKIISEYGKLKATQLSYITHEKDTAWANTTDEEYVITNAKMKECIRSV